MRTKILMAISVLLMLSCNKNEAEKPKEVVSKPVNENTFSAVIKDEYSILGKNVNPLKNMTNIQVGDAIPYQIEITDTNPDETNVKYSLFVDQRSEKFHQILNKDYQLQINPKDTENVILDTQKGILQFKRKGVYTFYIKPIRSGSFQLFFGFQKQKKDLPQGDNQYKELIFNAVQISVWTKRINVRSSNMWHSSVDRNDFYFKIDDGENEEDVFLTNRATMVQTYRIEYDGKVFTGDFNQGEIKFYQGPEGDVEPPVIRNRVISRIVITQKIKDAKEQQIEYNNVKF